MRVVDLVKAPRTTRNVPFQLTARIKMLHDAFGLQNYPCIYRLRAFSCDRFSQGYADFGKEMPTVYSVSPVSRGLVMMRP